MYNRGVPQRTTLALRSKDKKYLRQVLLDQGIAISADFFDAPRREELRVFFEGVFALVFGPRWLLRDSKSLQSAIDQHWKLRREQQQAFLPAEAPPSVDELLPYCDRQWSALVTMRLFECLVQFGTLFGISNVSLQDVARPTTDRLLLFASALASWIKFQSDTLSDELNEWDKLAEKREYAKDLRAEIDEMRMMTEKLTARVSSQAAEQQRLEEVHSAKESELKRLHDVYLVELERGTQLEHALAQTQNARREQETLIDRLESDIKDAKEQIVDSPRKILESICDMKARLAAEEQWVKREKTANPIGKSFVAIWRLLAERCREAKTATTDLLVAAREAESQCKEKKRCLAVMDGKKKENKSLCDKEKEARQKLTDAQEQLEQAREKCAQAAERITQRGQKLKLQGEAARRQNEEILNEIQSNKSAIAKLEGQITSIKELNQDRLARSRDLVVQYEQEIQKDQKDFARRISATIQRVESASNNRRLALGV